MEKVRRDKIRGGEDQRWRKSEGRELQGRDGARKRTKIFEKNIQCFVALEGRKVNSLKRRVRSQLAK